MRAPAMLLRALLAAGLFMAAAGAAALEVGDTVRLPEVRTLDGRTLSAAALAGKPLVVEYWATWCPFCAMQNPRLQKLYERTRGTPLQVLAISIDKDPREAADYMKKRGYTFPATMDSPALQAAFGKRKGLPELYVIDARGRVVQKEVGEMLEDDVAALERYAKP
ncbi:MULTISPECIES: TlpA disulfide reductase family protein [Cupriavidus]|uniref:TlpA disulfide reductase family protein n=1 Tax=Cupriavidus TaxID=106589 RepID=UPI000E2FF027|nr:MULTISPECIES: TlpA disulfide reductase family protein [Cupriavidus]MEC3768221.1 TlpA disulfide reductase family protein [Cupriavidus sp. SS-3]